MPLYVTHYMEYPIFEPAEGGYYYTGLEMGASVQVRTLKQAIKRAEEWAISYGLEKANDKLYYEKDVRYIGEGQKVVIETKRGKQVKGWHPYE